MIVFIIQLDTSLFVMILIILKSEENPMAFEKFTKTGQRFKPKVSIWSRGQIGISQGALERFKLHDYNYVILFYDRDNKIIGFKFTNEESEDGAIKLSVRNTGGVISGRAFLEYYGIDYSKTKQYDMIYDEGNELYVISLD